MKMHPIDEVNPHICWEVNREIPKPSVISSILHPERAQRVHGLAELFLDRYDVAWNAAVDYVPNYSDDFKAAVLGAELGMDGPFVPLAYRLNVRTKDGDDVLAHDKIGGLPDLRGEVYRWCKWEYLEYQHSKDHRSEKELKRKFPNGEPKIKPISKGLERIWPKCGCCGRHMQFVGQFRYMDWASAFHILTNRPTTYSSLSAFGSPSNGDTMLDDELHLYFYCPCNQWDNYNNDCAIVRQDNRFDKYEEVLAEIQGKPKPKSKPKLLYSDAQYKRAVTAFMKRHKVHPEQVDGDWYSPMPMQLVDKYQLGFLPAVGKEANLLCLGVLTPSKIRNATSTGMAIWVVPNECRLCCIGPTPMTSVSSYMLTSAGRIGSGHRSKVKSMGVAHEPLRMARWDNGNRRLLWMEP
jgi:hypothetical protein